MGDHSVIAWSSLQRVAAGADLCRLKRRFLELYCYGRKNFSARIVEPASVI